jgi:hypothetical protein
MTKTLIVEPVADYQGTGPWPFNATLDGKLVVRSHQPLVDGARELIKNGLKPSTLLTMRHKGSSRDVFPAQAAKEWARWTFDANGNRRAWVPFVAPR